MITEQGGEIIPFFIKTVAAMHSTPAAAMNRTCRATASTTRT